MANQTKPKSVRRKRKKILIFLITIITLIGICGFIAAKLLVGPSVGVVVESLPENLTKSAPTIELEQYEGVYFTFAYPNSYAIQPPSKDNANSLESHTFVASGMMNKIVTTTVISLPSGKLQDDPSYYMRSINPGTYKMSTQTLQGEKVVVFLNPKDSQQAAFWTHSGKLLTFTISSVSISSEATAQEYQRMLESIRWR